MSRTMTMSEAINEARRCLNCARPTCRTGCPIANNIPQFIRALAEGNIGLAYETIAERSNLPAICGRVCPHERQCEAHCVLTKNKHGIEIGSETTASFYGQAWQGSRYRQRPCRTDGGRRPGQDEFFCNYF